MRWLVTGAAGQLGHHLVAQLTDAGEDVIAATRADLDITDDAAVARKLETFRPDVVVNAAAYTAVDAAERDEAAAARVNADGPANLAEAARILGCRLLHVSTDYVFDGTQRRPYLPDDPPHPRSAYGRTKLAGEQAVRESGCDAVVVRTSWVFGGPGKNFVATMQRLAATGAAPRVVADQVGSPTYSVDLASALIALGRRRESPRVLHFANAETASWFELAQATFEATGHDPARVTPIGSEEYPTPAPRPAWSVLSIEAWVEAGLPAPAPWRDALRRWARTVS